MEKSSLSRRMANTARLLQDSQDDPHATFQSAVEVAKTAVNGCDAVGLTFVRRGHKVETVAYTDEMALTADHLQYEHEEGPCLDATWEHHVVRSRDLQHDERWPTWGPRVAHQTSAQSILSFQLFTKANHLGALNLYGKALDAFDDLAVEEGFAIAAHVSIAVAAALQVDTLSQGLASRTVIGQATGILMERYDMDAARAFGVLTRMSSQGNVKLRDLAADVVAHRGQGLGER